MGGRRLPVDSISTSMDMPAEPVSSPMDAVIFIFPETDSTFLIFLFKSVKVLWRSLFPQPAALTATVRIKTAVTVAVNFFISFPP